MRFEAGGPRTKCAKRVQLPPCNLTAVIAITEANGGRKVWLRHRMAAAIVAVEARKRRHSAAFITIRTRLRAGATTTSMRLYRGSQAALVWVANIGAIQPTRSAAGRQIVTAVSAQPDVPTASPTRKCMQLSSMPDGPHLVECRWRHRHH